MGDEVRVTVIAAGFDRWDDRESASSLTSPTRRLEDVDLLPSSSPAPTPGGGPGAGSRPAPASSHGLDDLDSEDEFDVPSFLK
jgi:hypothetical protein